MHSRDNRSVLLLGATGQARVRQASVALVGVGGLGSHAALQVAYQGFGKVVLVDHDRIGETSLNRWVLGQWSDVGRLKVEAGRERMLAIQPAMEVIAIPAKIDDESAMRNVLGCDYVVGSFDNDSARLALMTRCCAAARPYFDLATDVDPTGSSRYGGRVLFSHAGRGCLVCMRLIDPTSAHDGPEAVADHRAIYGVPREALEPSAGPAVVSTNAVVASVGVDALVGLAAGLREPRRLVTYRADLMTVTVSRDEPTPDCYFCCSLYGRAKRE